MEKRAPAQAAAAQGRQGNRVRGGGLACLILKGCLQSTEVGVAIQRLNKKPTGEKVNGQLGTGKTVSEAWFL